MMTNNDDNDPAARTIIITRTFDAPRDLVFAVWTERKHVARWWRPQVFERVDIEEMDLRPGGQLRILFRMTSGDEYRSICVYGEIAPPERLTYDESCYENGELFHRAHQIVRFEEVAGKTRLTLEGRLDLVAERDPRWTLAAMKQGWTQGWNENLDLLRSYLSELAAAHETASIFGQNKAQRAV
jgi:uncharacterized protein YndB with AHSA1/START domain